MPFLGLLESLQSRLSAGQNANSLPDILGGALTLDKYSQIIKPFIKTKIAPNNLASEIRTKANTEAVIMVLDNKSGVIKHITNKFFLSDMQMSMREKFQLMETFGAANISFFGENARIYSFSANTVDAASQDSGVSRGKYFYQSSILKMYNEVLRGTQLIKKDRIAIIKTNNHLIYGYPLNLNVTYNAIRDPVTTFTLQFLVADHSLEMPGVISESYLEKMYSIEGHINNRAILDFLLKINHIISKINTVLSTSVKGEEYNSSGAIEFIENAWFSWYNYQPDSMKSAYTSLLSANISALKGSISKTSGDQISPLVHSKVPDNTFNRLLALIPTMFKDEETFNLVATNLKNLIQLKKELIIFKSYRINRG